MCLFIDFFQLPGSSALSVHDALCKFIPTMLRPAYADSATTQSLLGNSWFFMELIAVSLARTVLKARESKVAGRRRARQRPDTGARAIRV